MNRTLENNLIFKDLKRKERNCQKIKFYSMDWFFSHEVNEIQADELSLK